MSPAPSYALDEQIGFILRQAYQRHAVLFSERFGEDFTPMQWAVVAKLAETGECSQNMLGRQTAMDVATIKGVIDRLVARGFVETAPDPNDGRRLILSLTPEGQSVIDRNIEIARAVTDETLAPLTSGERMMLIELLRKIC